MFSSKRLIQATLLATMLCAAGAQADKWSTPQEPFKLYGNTWYVGPHGVSAVLITSPAGHILIDGGSVDSAAPIAAHIRQLGFRLEDVRYILNSHEHNDHAGGIAELQRLTGATVLASEKSERVLRTGIQDKGDPQYEGPDSGIPAVAHTRVVRDGEVVTLGPLAVTAHYTPGHTQGATSWTWRAVENGVAENIVYADSLTAYTNDTFKYSHDTVYPAARAELEHSIAKVAAFDCDILVSVHPEVSDLWVRKDKGDFVDRNACKAYAAKGAARLKEELAEEAKRG